MMLSQVALLEVLLNLGACSPDRKYVDGRKDVS